MYETITEGKARIKVPKEEKVSADLPVFYNPVMKLNRDMSILLLKVLEREGGWQICDPLAGTGVRSVRMLLECGYVVKSITINDKDPESVKLIEENLKLNDLEDDKRVEILNRDANSLLRESSGFDYIDIDPFGTPNPFLDIAVRRISRDGVLAVTATDTSALSGTYINACKRKYWAVPRRDFMMHETGLRILMRKCQLIGAQYEKALVPIVSYSKDHYMRVFFLAKKGKKKVDDVLKQHGVLELGGKSSGEVGPMWLGKLWDRDLVEKMMSASGEADIDQGFLKSLSDECKVDKVGFVDLHALCKKNCLEVPNFEKVFDRLDKKGHRCVRTHFSQYGVRTDASEEVVLGIIKEILKELRNN